ncbi:TPA: lysis protein [Escherichia coli]|nr:lysis protein [Escherichia coli]
MKLSYKLVIAAFFVTVIGSFICSVNHYHNKAIEYKKQRDENAMALDSAMATIADMQKRQRDVAELDARYTKELANAKITISNLRRDIDAGRKRLRVKANCSANGATGTSGMGDASSPRLTDSAERDYFALRERIVTVTKQVSYLQSYIKGQCQK